MWRPGRRQPPPPPPPGCIATVDLPVGKDWAVVPLNDVTDESGLVRWAGTEAMKRLGTWAPDQVIDDLTFQLGRFFDRALDENPLWAAVWLPEPRAGVAAFALADELDTTEGPPPSVEELAQQARDQPRDDSPGPVSVDIVDLPAGRAVRIAGTSLAQPHPEFGEILPGEPGGPDLDPLEPDQQGPDQRTVVIESVTYLVLTHVTPLTMRLVVSWVSLTIGEDVLREADALAARLSVQPVG